MNKHKSLVKYLAILTFCTDWHGGLDSRLYRLQCRIQRKLARYYDFHIPLWDNWYKKDFSFSDMIYFREVYNQLVENYTK